MGYGRIMTHRRARTTGPASIVDFAHVDTGGLFMARALFVAGSAQAFLFIFFPLVLIISIIFKSLSLSLACVIALAELSFATLGLGTALLS